MIKVALIGCGKASKNHVRAINAGNEFELVAICDTDEKNLDEFGGKGHSAYTEQDEMLSMHGDVDLVVICTPPSTHMKCAEVPLIDGHAVLIEKPIARRSSDAKKIVDCIVSGSKVFEVKQNRYNAAIMAVKEAITTGAFGDIHMITARLRWCRFPEYYASEGWRGTTEDGGVFASQGCHILDLVRYLMLGPSPPGVYSAGNYGEPQVVDARMWNVMDLEVEDSGYAYLEWSEKSRMEPIPRGLVELTTTARPENLESSISILGSKGTVVIGGDRCNDVQTWKIDYPQPTDQCDVTYSYRRMYEEIAKSLRGEPSNVVTGEDALGSLRFIEAIYAAAEGPQLESPDEITAAARQVKMNSPFLEPYVKKFLRRLPDDENTPRNPILYSGNTIADDVEYGHHVLIRGPGTVIEAGCRIGSYTEISHHVDIGDSVHIHSKCFVPEYSKIEEGAWIGPCVVFVNDQFPMTGGKHRKGVTVQNGAIIGANATIMAGVTIGWNAIVGAGAVVTKDVPPGEVFTGNPATRLKSVSDLPAYA